MSGDIKSLQLCELVEDLTIYPRHQVDDVHVRNLAMALESGCTLPPIVLDAASLRIVDGWHRYRAHKRIYGNTGSICAEVRKFASEADIVAAAVQLNAAHGRRMDQMDLTRSVVMLQHHGLPVDRIAVIMSVTTDRVEKLSIRVAMSKEITNATIPNTKKITLKRCVAHLQGQKLTTAQAQVHDSLPGVPFSMIARQLRVAIENNMANLDDDLLREELGALRHALNCALA